MKKTKYNIYSILIFKNFKVPVDLGLLRRESDLFDVHVEKEGNDKRNGLNTAR